MSIEVYFMCAGKDVKGLHFYVSFYICQILHYRVQLNIKYRLDFSSHLTFKVFCYIYVCMYSSNYYYHQLLYNIEMSLVTYIEISITLVFL